MPRVEFCAELLVYLFVFLLHTTTALGITEGVPVLATLLIACTLRPASVLRAVKSGVVLVPVVVGFVCAVLASTNNGRNWLSLAQFTSGVVAGFVACDGVYSFGPALVRNGGAKRIAWFLVCTSALVLVADVGAVSPARLLIVIGAAYVVATARTRLAALAAIVVSAVGIVSTDAKVVYAAFLVALAIALFSRVPREHRLRGHVNTMLLFVALGAVTVLALVVFSPARVADILQPSDSISTLARAGLALAGIEATADHPILGLGPAGLNISENFNKYYSDELLLPLIYSGDTRSHAEEYGSGLASGTHNMYLDLSSSYGIPLTVFILLALWRGMRKARTTHRLSIGLAGAVVLIEGMGWQYSSSPVGMLLVAMVMAAGARDPRRS